MSIRMKLYSLVAGLLIMTLGLMSVSAALLYKEYQTFVYLQDSALKPLNSLKQMSDLYAVHIVDTVHKVNAGSLRMDEGATSISNALVSQNKIWAEYVKAPHSPEEQAQIDKAKTYLNAALGISTQLKELMLAGNKEQLQLQAQKALYPAIDPFTGAISDLLDITLKAADAQVLTTKNELVQYAIYLLIANILLISLAAFLASKLVKRISSSVQLIASITDRVSESKNLTWRTQMQGKDELATIGTSFDNLLLGMEGLVADAKQSTGLLDGQAQDVARTAQAISYGSVQQSEATSAMASTLEQIAVSIAHLSDSAKHVQEQSDTARQLSLTSKSAVDTVLTEISAISGAVLKTESQVQVLAQQSADISRIVRIIKDVADQTNLLALNAAIEAARAGEAGRGFAVVADEVRKLAERTANATKEIDMLTTQITTSTQNVAHTMKESVRHVKQGEELIDSTTQSINHIETAIQQVHSAASEMANSLQEQHTASNDIAQQVETIAQLSQQNADNSQEASLIAKRLSQEVSVLNTQLQAYTASNEH